MRWVERVLAWSRSRRSRPRWRFYPAALLLVLAVCVDGLTRGRISCDRLLPDARLDRLEVWTFGEVVTERCGRHGGRCDRAR